MSDALVAREYAAGGFVNTQLANIGRVEAHGWEIKLHKNPLFAPFGEIEPATKGQDPLAGRWALVGHVLGE